MLISLATQIFTIWMNHFLLYRFEKISIKIANIFIHSTIHNIQLKINCKKKWHKFLVILTKYESMLSKSPTIIQSDITKLKNFVKFWQDKISNSRFVNFFKIASGSAHVLSGGWNIRALISSSKLVSGGWVEIDNFF